MPTFTVCPPATAHTLAPEVPFDDYRRNKIVANAVYRGLGEWESTGIVWEACHTADGKPTGFHKTTLRKQGFGYRLPIPAWANNDMALREIVVRCMELRAGWRRRKQPLPGTLQERLARAEAKLLAQQPGRTKAMHRLNEEYVNSATTPERKKVLEVQIQNLDTVIRVTPRAAAVTAYIVATYYRRKMSSPEIAADLGIRPMTVRRILHHVRRVVERMEREKKALADEANSTVNSGHGSNVRDREPVAAKI